MLKARPDRKNPSSSSGAKPAGMIGSRSVDRIRAAVICAANAVHMTAPAEDHHAQKTLATGEPSTHDEAWRERRQGRTVWEISEVRLVDYLAVASLKRVAMSWNRCHGRALTRLDPAIQPQNPKRCNLLSWMAASQGAHDTRGFLTISTRYSGPRLILHAIGHRVLCKPFRSLSPACRRRKPFE